MKKKKPKKRNETHIKKDKNTLLIEDFKYRYQPKRDEFFMNMTFLDSQTGKKYNVRGVVESAYLNEDGIRVRTPKRLMSQVRKLPNQIVELFLTKEEFPNLTTMMLGFVNTTGDMIDDDLYKEEKHGLLRLRPTDSDGLVGNYFNDDSLRDRIIWEHSYQDEDFETKR